MSETFTSAFPIIRGALADAEGVDEEERAYLHAPERLREAEAVEPVVERFVDLEFAPPEGRGVRRGAKWPVAEPLAKSLTRQLGEMDEADLEWMRDTVLVSIASGYVFLCLAQAVGDLPRPESGVDPPELWKRWMLQLPTDILVKALSKSSVKIALEAAHFEKAMKMHGVYKLKTAGAIKLLSATYARAGLTLRLLQSTTQYDQEPHKKAVKGLPDWPFVGTQTSAG